MSSVDDRSVSSMNDSIDFLTDMFNRDLSEQSFDEASALRNAQLDAFFHSSVSSVQGQHSELKQEAAPLVERIRELDVTQPARALASATAEQLSNLQQANGELRGEAKNAKSQLTDSTQRILKLRGEIQKLKQSLQKPPLWCEKQLLNIGARASNHISQQGDQ